MYRNTTGEICNIVSNWILLDDIFLLAQETINHIQNHNNIYVEI